LAPDGITVADLVGRGRTPHQGLFGRWSARDHEVVARALLNTGIADLADRSVDELSGGQRQRVWIAMALAQDTDILLLDEPTTYLDIAHQIDILDLLRDLNAERGTTVVMVLHDLNLASRYCDQLVALSAGRVVSAGPPAQVITPALIREVFDLPSRIVPDPVSGAPLVLPVGRHGVLDPALHPLPR
ncbi:ABC transporter ATP-binding protein, partial [Corynebacterium nasicanis]